MQRREVLEKAVSRMEPASFSIHGTFRHIEHEVIEAPKVLTQPDPDILRRTRQFVVRHGGEIARPNKRTVVRRVGSRHLTVPVVEVKLADQRIQEENYSEGGYDFQNIEPMEKHGITQVMRSWVNEVNSDFKEIKLGDIIPKNGDTNANR